jgi:hypothetical protein
MRRVVFFVIAACVALLNVGCEPYIVTDQELVSLQYTTTDGKALELNSKKFAPSMVLNKYDGIGEIFFAGTLKEIFQNAFANQDRLTMVDLPLGLEGIGEEAFYGCTNLETVHIPGTVKRIGDFSFYGCDNLKTVYFYGSEPPALSSNVFDYESNGALTICVPKQHQSKYINKWGSTYSKYIKTF